MGLEYRDDSSAIVTGRPIVYDSVTDLGEFYEVIDNGALNDADLSDICFLTNHDLNKIPVARYREGNPNSSMSISIDKNGMMTNSNLDIGNNLDSRALCSSIKRGDITGMSFLFGIAEEAWEEKEDKPLRRIKKISVVVEVSAVTYPAYEATKISARDKRALLEAKQKLSPNLELEKLRVEILNSYI